MPKKRNSNLYTNLYAKQQSSSAGSSKNTDIQPNSVNDLITSLRRTQVTPSNYAQLPPTFSSQTLPPQTRSLLSLPETPAPRPRYRSDGRTQGSPFRPAARRIVGPTPRSWLEGSQNVAAPELKNRPERLYPTNLNHLPGLPDIYESDKESRRLQDVCLRTMARNWEYIREYERNNLADLPTPLRVLLLSNIAIHGPEEGVGYEGLQNLLLFPTAEGADTGEASSPLDLNEGFHRYDLSGSMGRSISFKQLLEFVEKPVPSSAEEDPSNEDVTWEETLARPLNATLPHLTHLSLSHPPPTISWTRLLNLAKHIPTLTHLSLAYWPVPALTPNAKTAVVASKYARDIQYGGTNYYSHSLDDDYREAVSVLRKLADRLYGLEFLDLSGCHRWLRALSWHGGEDKGPGIDWANTWTKLTTLRLYSGISINVDSKYLEVLSFSTAWKQARIVEEELHWWTHKDAIKRRFSYVDVEKDNPEIYRDLWKGMEGEESRKKRGVIQELGQKRRSEAPAHIFGAEEARRSSPVWRD